MDRSEDNEIEFYTEVKEYLQQADIFRVDVVSPIADTQKRIFRTADGCHGSLYFEGTAQARVFSEEDLTAKLSIQERGPYHSAPFCQIADGSNELVVVEAKKIKYFVIASQTCDISGKDKKALPFATLLPIITLYDVCRTETLPFDKTESYTIHDFLLSHCDGTEELNLCNEYTYGCKIKELVRALLQSGLNKNLAEKVSRIKNFINQGFANSIFTYLLQENQEKQIPESYIDFSVICTVPTPKLEALKPHRLCRLQETYHMSFIKQFATFFERVAEPKAMRKRI